MAYLFVHLKHLVRHKNVKTQVGGIGFLRVALIKHCTELAATMGQIHSMCSLH